MKLPYRITDRAGPYVAGRRVSPGDVLELAAPEAAAEKPYGTIEPVDRKVIGMARTAPPDVEPSPAEAPAAERRGKKG